VGAMTLKGFGSLGTISKIRTLSSWWEKSEMSKQRKAQKREFLSKKSFY
jgi:hypothetical protein